MRKTIKNVMMVVPVLMTSCQVLLKWKIGPVTAQRITTPSAARNACGRPVARAVALEQVVKKLLVVFIGLIGRILSELGLYPLSKVRIEQGSDGSARRDGLSSRS